jgi:hypothetical protein
MTTQPKPASYIEGIGPATASKLESIGVYTVDDLLRGSEQDIHAGVHDVASVENVRAWRQMAQLLQVRGMTNQWAEAAQGAGIDKLSALHTKSVDELSAIFAASLASGTISDVPSASTSFEVLHDALELDLTGILVGAIVNAQSEAIPDATVRVGIQSVKTDGRGRFRLTRIPLGHSYRLIVSGETFRTLEVENPPIVVNEDRLDKATYTLARRAANEPIPFLDQFDGDVLPRLTAHTMRTVRQEAGTLREGDVFVLHKFYKRTPDVLLASMFWAYQEGKFLVRTSKVAVSDLPSDPGIRGHYIYKKGSLQSISMSSSRLEMKLLQRRVRKEFVGRPKPTTLIEIDNRQREHAELMRRFISE